MNIFRALSRYILGCYDDCIRRKSAERVIRDAESVLRALKEQQRETELYRQRDAEEKRINLRTAVQQFALAKAQIRVAQRLNCLTGIAAGFAFVAAGGVIWSVIEAKDATVDANRAWFGVPDVLPTSTLDEGDPIKYGIIERNYGHGPANHLVLGAIDNGFIDGPKDDDFSRITFSDADMCKGLHLSHAGSTRFPNTDRAKAPDDQPIQPYIGENSDLIRKGVIVTPEMLNGTKVFYVRGCFVYETMNILGRTSFCELWHVAGTNAAGLPIIQTLSCARGQNAD